jgi:hypothetical protein
MDVKSVFLNGVI